MAAGRAVEVGWLRAEAVEVSWLQAEQQSVSFDGSAVPASGSDSGLNIWSSIYRLVIGSQVYRRNHSVDYSHSSIVVVCSGSSTVLATGLFRWQYNANNRFIFRRQISTESYW